MFCNLQDTVPMGFFCSAMDKNMLSWRGTSKQEMAAIHPQNIRYISNFHLVYRTTKEPHIYFVSQYIAPTHSNVAPSCMDTV